MGVRVCVCHWKPFVVQMCLMCSRQEGKRGGGGGATATAVKVQPKLDIIVFTCVQLRAAALRTPK